MMSVDQQRSRASEEDDIYLGDDGIRRRADEINFVARLPKHPFEPDVQIRLCSVDLRVDTIFWRARRRPGFFGRDRSEFDLRKPGLNEVSPNFPWERIQLAPGESYVLQPGELLLGRTYEEFSIPKGFAGKMSGRSSYSRIGLMVHCGADFMNPGWRGHQPLQLVNLSPRPIRIMPLLPVVQLSFVHVAEHSGKLYGSNETEDWYMDDDGGPSFWWRDPTVRHLVSTYGENNLPLPTQRRLRGLLQNGDLDPGMVYRLNEYVNSLQAGTIASADQLLSDFSRRESKVERRWTVWRNAALIIEGAVVGTALGAIFVVPFTPLHFAIWAAAFLLAVPSIWLVARRRTTYFSSARWEAMHDKLSRLDPPVNSSV